mgnify:CR=1 FL=1
MLTRLFRLVRSESDGGGYRVVVLPRARACANTGIRAVTPGVSGTPGRLCGFHLLAVSGVRWIDVPSPVTAR